MTARNDITGDSIRTRGISQKYKDNWEVIFGKKGQDEEPEDELTDEEE